MKSYKIVVSIGGELLCLSVPKAISEYKALQQVYDSDQVKAYKPEDIENLGIIDIIEELEE